MKTLSLFLSFICVTFVSLGQQSENLPYQEIPEQPDSFTASNVAARVVDGLGFRYYWATEGLRQEDLDFRPTPESRSTEETVFHIYELSQVIVNAVLRQPNIRTEDAPTEFAEIRRKTLENIKTTSDMLRACSDEEMEKLLLVFGEGEDAPSYPFWNLLNGPLADALWHTGQVVSHRRTSGNPFNGNVSVFNGKLREQVK